MALLGIIDPIVIDSLGITLTDQKTLSKENQATARKIMVDVLQRQTLDVQRGGTFLCGHTRERYVDDLYKTEQARRLREGEKLTNNRDFELSLGDAIVRDDSDCDPRLSVKTFVVSSGQEILGLWTLYNIVIEIDDKTGITATAMAMPGCEAVRGFSLRETWTGIMRWILENDFTASGRKVDFIGWAFPSRRDHQWLVSEDQASSLGGDANVGAAAIGNRKAVADLDDHAVFVNVDGVPVSVRRREPPRKR